MLTPHNPIAHKPIEHTPEETGIVDGNHALLVGMILGALMKTELDAEPMMLGSDYTNEIVHIAPLGGLPRDDCAFGLLMAIYYPCPACEAGHHEDCHKFRPATHPDGFDGWMCSCDCVFAGSEEDDSASVEVSKVDD